MKLRSNGFTLVELLVTVSIIALLCALSYQALLSAFRWSQLSKCAGNLRQISVAFQAYVTDHNNTMPQRFYTASSLAYFNVLAPYAGNVTEKNLSIFVCPAHTQSVFPIQPSYGMNWYYDNASLLSITSPSTTIMVAESAGPGGKGSNRADKDNGDPGELAYTRHNGSANYLFFDGHVEKLTYAATANLWGIDQGNHNQPAPP